MTNAQKRKIRRIQRSIKKHLLALGYLCGLVLLTLGIGKFIYETGILLILDTLLGTIFR